MSKHFDRQLKIQKSCTEQLRAIYRRARTDCLSQSTVLDMVSEQVYGSTGFKRATRPTKEFIVGYGRALFDAHWDSLVFAHEVDGKRYAIFTPEYEALSPQRVHEEGTWSGFVYKEDYSRNW